MNGGTTKIVGPTNNIEIMIDKAIKNDMNSIPITIKITKQVTNKIIDISITINTIKDSGDMIMNSMTKIGLEKENKKIGINDQIIIIIITKINGNHNLWDLIVSVNMMRA